MALLRVHSLDKSHHAFDVWPTTPGDAFGEQPAVLCLRPGEWQLIDTVNPDPEAAIEEIRGMIDPQRCVVLDLSDGLVLSRLSGPTAPWLLSKLGGLDFLVGARSSQHCAQTRIGDAAVLVHYHHLPEAGWVFDLVADRSLAKYLDQLLNASLAHACELAEQFGEFR